jgi:MFS family permease
VREGALGPVTALRRTVRDPRLVRVQLAWAAVIAFWMITVSLSVVAFAEGGSAAVAVALLARTVVGTIANPLIGALVDRVSRQRCMVWGAALAGLASAGAAAAGDVLPAVVVLVTLATLVAAAFRAAQSAIVPELVDDPADLTAVNVLSSAIESAGVFLGPALAGILLVLQGPRLAFGVAAALFIVAALLLLGLQGRPIASRGSVAAARGRTRDLFRNQAARLILLLLFAQTVLSGGLVVLLPALAVDVLDAELSTVGVLTSAYGLGGVVGSLALFALAGSSRLGLFSALALLLWAVPLLLVPLTASPTFVLLLLVVVGGGNVLFDVTSVTLLQRGVPPRLLGRAFCAVETAAVLGLGAGAVAASALDGALEAGAALAVLAAPLAVVAVLALPSLRRLDRQLTAPTRQVQRLRAVPAFALLPPVEIERLALHLQRVVVAPADQVVRQGESGSTWFLVDEGRLDADVDGRTVRTLVPGDAFGEIALLRQGVRTASVTARTPAVLWSLEGSVFLAALRADDGTALAALDALAQERLAHAAPMQRTWSS